MYFTKAVVMFSLAVSALAMPVFDLEDRSPKSSKAASNTAGDGSGSGSGSSSNNAAVSGAAVLTTRSYAEFQVSDGVAGNALAEVQAKFPIDENNLAGVAASDLDIIKAARVTAEDAEVGTGGFNDAIAAAGAGTVAGKALQVGKIKNKCLKLKLEVLGLQIDQAQTGKDNSAKIAQEQKKLDNNIAIDKKSAGATSQSVNFTGK